jgi:hypothetical protein
MPLKDGFHERLRNLSWDLAEFISQALKVGVSYETVKERTFKLGVFRLRKCRPTAYQKKLSNEIHNKSGKGLRRPLLPWSSG